MDNVFGESHATCTLVRYMYIYLQFLNNVILIQTKVLLPEAAQLILTDFGYPGTLDYLPPNTSELFGFPFDYEVPDRV
jgi:hypothetical protein